MIGSLGAMSKVGAPDRSFSYRGGVAGAGASAAVPAGLRQTTRRIVRSTTVMAPFYATNVPGTLRNSLFGARPAANNVPRPLRLDALCLLALHST